VRSDWTAAARCDEFPQVQLNGGRNYWSWEGRAVYKYGVHGIPRLGGSQCDSKS
jgi:hypothetical protein